MASNLKLQFDSNLDYQGEAISSVVDLFEGQSESQSVFTVSSGARITKITGSNFTNNGIGNRLEISSTELLENLQKIQLRNGILQSQTLGNVFDFTIEMETGTGKTYVYTRSIMELYTKYRFTKFIIVVPSLAIKEGVKKSLQITESHFKNIYDNIQYDYFIYDSNKLELVRDFATNDYISIMIINIDAFRKDENIINRINDHLNGLKPIELIQSTNPIVIIDEPQSVDSTPKAKEAIRSLNPLCIFRYSATHRQMTNLVYRLNAIDAYERKLVKSIEVAGFSSLNDHNEPYIKLVSIESKKGQISAKIEIDAESKDGLGIRKKTITVKQDSDLEEKTGRSIYKNLFVDEIHCELGNEYLLLSNDKYLRIGESIGEVDDLLTKTHMIRRTIQEHLDKELELNKRGIKVLSLFFIDRVAKYRNKGQKGIYAEIFEDEYVKLIQRPKYRTILKDMSPHIQAQLCHDGYFSQDKQGFVDSNGNTTKDNSTYERIMIDKEKLLSLDDNLRFIFSHSALREGWDNPNVFQICTLTDSKGEIDRRQKIGRGLRLCVDQLGNRVYDPSVNLLTVMANESFEDFAIGLQHEYTANSGIRFGVINANTFSKMVINNKDGEDVYLGDIKSKVIYQSFIDNGYINDKGKVLDKLREDISLKNIQIPDEFVPYKNQIIDTCKLVCGSFNLKNCDDKRVVNLKKNVFLGPDFIDLWNKIKFKTKYELHFDSDKLVENCADIIQREVHVKPPMLMYNKAAIEIDVSGVRANSSIPVREDNLEVNGELPDIITHLQNKTDLTRRTIVRILTNPKVDLNEFIKNPQMFIEAVSRIIVRQVRSMALSGIVYKKVGEYYAQEIFDSEEFIGYLNKNIVESEHSIYDYTIYDSDIERKFALDLDKIPNVKLYAKLPPKFIIPTPIGDYNPDWAVLVQDLDGEHLYFVFETKGNVGNNRPSEEYKIECGKKHFKAISGDSANIHYSANVNVKGVLMGINLDSEL